MSESIAHHDVHRDDEASKLGIWLFIFTELLFFGGLFITYAVYRHANQEAFHLAAQELDVTVGTINTVILLISSMTIAMATTAIQKKDKRTTLILIGITLLLALVFLVNKYFEWSRKIEHGIWPGSPLLEELGRGDTLFFGLYYFMTGLHALHIIIGMVLIIVYLSQSAKGQNNFRQFPAAGKRGPLLAPGGPDLDLPLSSVLFNRLILLAMSDNTHHIVPYRTYGLILVLFLVLTGISVAVTQIELSRWSTLVALLLATTKIGHRTGHFLCT